MRVFLGFTVLASLLASGCSGNDKSTAACSALGTLHDGSGSVPFSFDPSCTYAVTKHAGAACPAYDIAIGGLTLYAFPPPNTESFKVGLVLSVSSLDATGEFTTDPSQLCGGLGYFTLSGDWTSVGRVVTDGFWPAPGEQASVTVPIMRSLQLTGVAVARTVASGNLGLSLTAD